MSLQAARSSIFSRMALYFLFFILFSAIEQSELAALYGNRTFQSSTAALHCLSIALCSSMFLGYAASPAVRLRKISIKLQN